MVPFTFPKMVKELCNRCGKPVYPTDKIGPLKDSTFFHHGCFKCYICGTRLALKTYCNNRNNIDDKEVYCNNHVPNANPHDLPPVPAAPAATRASRGVHHFVAPTRSGQDNPTRVTNTPVAQHNDAGLQDMKIAHAMKATQVAKPYPKIKHEGAKYIVDYDDQTRLELIHRKDEDDLYKHFYENRKKELNQFEEETKEEWEKALTDFARRYEKGEASAQNRDDLLRQLTIRRDKKLETLTLRRKERERHQTAELVEQQAREMMELFRQARTDQKNEPDENQNYIYDANSNGRTQTQAHLMDKKGLPATKISSKTTSKITTTTTKTTSYHSNGAHQHKGGYGAANEGLYSTVGAAAEADFEEDEKWERAQRATAAQRASYPETPPPPLPPSCSKRHVYTDASVFSEIDQIAASVAHAELNTFTDLVRALTAGARSDVDKARAIFKWITVKNLNVMVFDNATLKDTPMGLLRGIKYGTESYHVLFKRLCSYAGLHCVVVKGYSKSAGYQPGTRFDEGQRFRNTWNAVFLDGSWRFVQCNWGARHLVNNKGLQMHMGTYAENGDNYDTVESSSRRDGSLRYEYDDHYFMTDPEEFIYEFFPQQSEWQLLPRPITLRQFEELPFVRSLFFRYGLRFTDSRIPAVLRADRSGAATISISAAASPSAAPSPMFTSTSSRSSSSGYGDDDLSGTLAGYARGESPTGFNFGSLIFHYNLRFYDSNGGTTAEDTVDGLSLKRFVMQSTLMAASQDGAGEHRQGHAGQSAVIFRVHTPCTRPLLMDIFCNAVPPNHYLTGTPIKFKSVCKFKIVCESLNVIMVPLPDCASGEWGPAKSARLFGLIPVTHPEAIINCEQYCEIRFKMTKPLSEFLVILHKNCYDSRHLQRCCQVTTRSDEVLISLEFPDEGQYGLDIYTRDPNQSKNMVTHCCKYLINARVD